MSQLFTDIETVRQFKADSNGIVAWPKPELVDIYGKRFKHEIEKLKEDHEKGMLSGQAPESISFQEALDLHYAKNAALYAEWGKIVCIGMGVFHEEKLKVKYLCGRHEKQLLLEFAAILQKITSVVGHNVIEFDVPLICRRMIVHGIDIPKVLQTEGKYKNQIAIHDTVEMWGMTQWKYKASLALLCEVLGIESPKGDMDGSKVGEVYWGMFDGVESDELPFEKEKEALDKIGNYCIGDVIATANVFNRIKNKPIFTPAQIVYQNGLV